MVRSLLPNSDSYARKTHLKDGAVLISDGVDGFENIFIPESRCTH